jgi:hypothetical protein
MNSDLQAKLESFICNSSSHTKAELLLGYSTREPQKFVEVQAYHVGPLDWTNEGPDDEHDVVIWRPQSRLGKCAGVGIAISLDTPHATLVRLLRKSLEMLESCPPDMWDAVRRKIAGCDAPATTGDEVDF